MSPRPQFLTLFTSKCASRHSAVHFFDISTSKSAPKPSVFNTFYFQMCFAPQRRALFQHLNFQIGAWQFLTLFTSKRASRHSAMHFFDSSPSKSAPRMRCLVHFYLEMCFAPQRRALFQHLNFQKCSEAEVFCTFSLQNLLRVTTACKFSSLISPDVSAPAALASLLFDPPEPQNHEKTQCFATFLPFRAPASSFFWSFLFWLFSLLTAFSSLHIVGRLTSKLPSNMHRWKSTDKSGRSTEAAPARKLPATGYNPTGPTGQWYMDRATACCKEPQS